MEGRVRWVKEKGKEKGGEKMIGNGCEKECSSEKEEPRRHGVGIQERKEIGKLRGRRKSLTK